MSGQVSRGSAGEYQADERSRGLDQERTKDREKSRSLLAKLLEFQNGSVLISSRF